MRRNRPSTSLESVPEIPRGAHSARRQPPDPQLAAKGRRPGARHRRSRRRRGVVLGSFATAAAALALIIFFATQSSPSPSATRGSTTTTRPHSSSTTRPASTTTTTTGPPRSTTTSTTSTSGAPTAATVAPSSVLVEILNGVGTPHVAEQAAVALRARGFLINGTGNAAAFDNSENVIEYPPGLLAAAETLSHYVSGATRFEMTTTIPSSEVWVTLGATYDGVVG
jgi:hypothetical protein